MIVYTISVTVRFISVKVVNVVYFHSSTVLVWSINQSSRYLENRNRSLCQDNLATVRMCITKQNIIL